MRGESLCAKRTCETTACGGSAFINDSDCRGRRFQRHPRRCAGRGTCDDKSSPLYTPFVNGTYDYVTGTGTYDDKSYYITKSGCKVETIDAKVFDGYVLPTNTISAYKGYTAGETRGTEVYYYRAFSQPLASSVHKSLVSAWREIYKGNAAMTNKIVPKDGGVRYYPFRVTRIEECPAVLVECGYLSNTTECNAVCQPANQEKLAGAVANGILRYLENNTA